MHLYHSTRIDPEGVKTPFLEMSLVYIKIILFYSRCHSRIGNPAAIPPTPRVAGMLWSPHVFLGLVDFYAQRFKGTRYSAPGMYSGKPKMRFCYRLDESTFKQRKQVER